MRRWTRRDILFDFLENDLGLDIPAEKMDLQIEKPVAGKTRPKIARFLRYPDRERVLRASFDLSRVRNKSSGGLSEGNNRTKKNTNG